MTATMQNTKATDIEKRIHDITELATGYWRH